jgi:hypothetical protein
MNDEARAAAERRRILIEAFELGGFLDGMSTDQAARFVYNAEARLVGLLGATLMEPRDLLPRRLIAQYVPEAAEGGPSWAAQSLLWTLPPLARLPDLQVPRAGSSTRGPRAGAESHKL